MTAWVAAALAGWLLVPSVAAEAEPAAAQPDVLVLVSAAQNGIDHVAITYWGAVGERKARGHLRALLQSTAWQAQGVVIEVPRASAGKPSMTSVSFSTPAIVPYPEGMLPVVPFIEAYKEYGSLVLVFQTQRPFGFGGPAAYQDGHVAISLQQSPGVYRYDVTVADRGFTALDLPHAIPAGAQQETGAPARTSPPVPLVLALVVAASVSVGAAVYLYLASHATGASRPRA